MSLSVSNSSASLPVIGKPASNLSGSASGSQLSSGLAVLNLSAPTTTTTPPPSATPDGTYTPQAAAANTPAPVASAPIVATPVVAVPAAPVAPVTVAPVTVAPVSSTPVDAAPVASAPVVTAPASVTPVVTTPVATVTIAPVATPLAPLAPSPAPVVTPRPAPVDVAPIPVPVAGVPVTPSPAPVTSPAVPVAVTPGPATGGGTGSTPTPPAPVSPSRVDTSTDTSASSKLRRDTLRTSTDASSATKDRVVVQGLSDAEAALDILSSLQASTDGRPRGAADLIRESREGIDKFLADQRAKAEKAKQEEGAKSAANDTEDKKVDEPIKIVDLKTIYKAYGEFDADKPAKADGTDKSDQADAAKQAA